jgi:hypothetical protein
VAQVRATRRELRRLARAAVAAGELRSDADPARVARAVEVTVSGSLVAWAVHSEGSAASWMRHDLDTALRPWLAGQPRPRPRGRRRWQP